MGANVARKSRRSLNGADPEEFGTIFTPGRQEPVPPNDSTDSASQPSDRPAGGVQGDLKATNPSVHETTGHPRESSPQVLPEDAGTLPLENQPALDAVRVKLEQLEIIQPGDWTSAVAAVSSDLPQGAASANLSLILEKIKWLAANPQRRPSASDQPFTDYQIEEILAGRIDGLRFHDCIILGRLGKGGMGQVVKTLNLNLHRIEAIKTVLRAKDGGPTESSPWARERFEREARVLAQFDHPHLTRIFHFGRDPDADYIVMEFVDGQDLRTLIDESKDRGELPPVWWVVERIIAVAQALQHAHEQNVIHRDVKPSNVMITKDNGLKVLDMGIARLVEPVGVTTSRTRLTQSASGLGTPEVMSPEQWSDASEVRPQSDIYSLGCTLFFSLTGRMPFVAPDANSLMYAHVNQPVPKASLFRPDVPSELDAVIEKMMAKRYEDRHQSCDEVIEALEPFRDPPTHQEKNSTFARYGQVVGAAALGIAMALAGFFGGKMWIDHQKAQKGGDVNHTGMALDDWIEEFQRAHAGEWRDSTALWAHAGLKPGERIDEQKADQLKQRLEKETVRRRTSQWLSSWQAAHGSLWTGEDLAKVAAIGLPDSLDDHDFEQWRNHVRLETKKRIIHWRNAWIANHAAEHARAWPKVDDLAAKAQPLLAIDDIPDDRRRQKWSKTIESWTDAIEKPFDAEAQTLKTTGDIIRDYHLGTLRAVYRELSSCQGMGAGEGDVNFTASVNGKPVRKVHVDDLVSYEIQSSLAGYVTLIVFESKGKQFLLQWTQKLEADSPRVLFTSRAKEQGVDRLVVYVTERDPLADCPSRPDSIKPLVRKEGQLNGMLTHSYDAAELKEFRDSFRRPEAYDRLARVIEGGVASPIRMDHSLLGTCRRQSLAIEVVPKNDE